MNFPILTRPSLYLCRNQGAILSNIVPESLLEYNDYLQWCAKMKQKSSDCKDEVQFNEMSNEAWTCILMQVIKVFNIRNYGKEYNYAC